MNEATTVALRWWLRGTRLTTKTQATNIKRNEHWEANNKRTMAYRGQALEEG